MGVSNDSQSLMPLRLRCPVQALIAQPEFVAALLAQINRVQNSQYEAALEQLRLGTQVGRSEASLRCAYNVRHSTDSIAVFWHAGALHRINDLSELQLGGSGDSSAAARQAQIAALHRKVDTIGTVAAESSTEQVSLVLADK
jgi:hypothetical protein